MTRHPTPQTGPAFIAALNKALLRNPPPRRDRHILSAVAPYGIGPGLDPEQPGLDPATEEALHQAIAAEARYLPQSIKVRAGLAAARHDGWFDPPDGIGRYGTDYELRAQIAAAGLGANTRVEAIYPTGVLDGTGAPLVGENRYRLTFAPGELPPVRYFWSLTMYDADGYLVANPQDRYAVGPTHPPFRHRPDGSVVIVMSQERPEERDVNWLPSPSGQFRLNLRLYGPRASALRRRWTPPPIEPLPAIGGHDAQATPASAR